MSSPLTHIEVRERFLKFFRDRNHIVLPSAPLVPDNDPTVLFNTAGMQPLGPYLLGHPHPMGKRLASSQKCVRTVDIDDVGDNTHATFFEMLGNWSLGDYFKREAIEWSYEFLTSEDAGLGLDPARLYITVFAGDNNSPRDTEAFDYWKRVGIPDHRIYFKDAKSNWWPAVKDRDTWTGPTGPCSEMFYDITPTGLGDLTPEEYDKADERQDIVEIWNDVFMQFEKKDGKIIAPLKSKNIDTGAGFERLLAVIQKVPSIFDTDIFMPYMQLTRAWTQTERSARIVADHIRASIFLISDSVTPSNTDQGYILRRLIRRAIFNTSNKSLSIEQVSNLVDKSIATYSGIYDLLKYRDEIISTICNEVDKFTKTLAKGLKEFEKLDTIDGKQAFVLFTSFGFPFEMTRELAKTKGIAIDEKAFTNELTRHQKQSREGAEDKFKGGLADTSEMSVKYHTATHLLHQALREVLGNHVMQKGSNITPERLRFDFSHPDKLTDSQKRSVQDIVNEYIRRSLPVKNTILPKSQAEATGALHLFNDYGDEVSVYYIGEEIDSAISKEFCGGPHVDNTGVLGHFSLIKEEAVSAGIRRIKAVLTTK